MRCYYLLILLVNNNSNYSLPKIKKKKKSKSKSASELLKEGGAFVNKPDLNAADSNGSDATTKVQVAEKPGKTKAELAYERFNEKRNEEKILKRAEKSHKDRVELYNKHLDSLSEYNDIPKVSWTK